MNDFKRIYDEVKTTTGCGNDAAAITTGLVMLCNRMLPQTPPAEVKPAPAQAPVQTVITLDELRLLVAEKSKKGLTESIRAILAAFNAKKLPDLKPETYPAVKARLEDLAA